MCCHVGRSLRGEHVEEAAKAARLAGGTATGYRARMTENSTPGTEGMSPYERRRWAELDDQWAKADQRPQIVPAKVRSALASAGGQVADVGGRAAERVAAATPDSVKDAASSAVDAALVPTLKAVVHLLELVTDWSVELTDPERVLAHHRDRDREASSLDDLRTLDLEHLDEVTRTLPLRWRSLGAAEGAAMGALAFVPGGGIAAIPVDVLVIHVLSTSIATRAAHAYGFDPSSPQTERMIDRMVRRAYLGQAPKVETQRKAGAAFAAAAGRVKWSDKLRQDHRVLAAVEKLMKQAGNGAHVPVAQAAKALPFVAVLAGAGMNSTYWPTWRTSRSATRKRCACRRSTGCRFPRS